MAKTPASNNTSDLEVCMGEEGTPIGRLIYARQGAREFSQFAYYQSWLDDARSFGISPDLAMHTGYQTRKPDGKNDSSFFMAMADTEPDAWGRRVIARAHAKRRRNDPTLGALSELDYLASVDDISRVGALRLKDRSGRFLGTTSNGGRATPTLLELDKVLNASRAVEMGKETEEDLRYLRGKGTSLGGMRPKCSIIDRDGHLAIGKFPSIGDERSVTRGEVLAMQIAGKAGVRVAETCIEIIQGTPVAVIRRFDRTSTGRIPYMSGATLLQASRDEDRSYIELLDQMKSVCANYAGDARELWRRLVVNHLITNVDDHLQNIGFLYVGNGQWSLSPAFDINPMPDKDRESKTWLSEASGPIVSIEQLLADSHTFCLSPTDAVSVLQDVVLALTKWRELGLSSLVGMNTTELDSFATAFEHSELQMALESAGLTK